MIDVELEEAMGEALSIVVMGRAARNDANIKNRQPLAQMFVKAPESLPQYFEDIITDELNVKKISFTDDVRAFTSYSFKPQLRTVGPKYGKCLGGIRKYLSSVDGNEAMDELKSKGSLTFDVNGTEVILTEDDLLIDVAQKEGFVSQQSGSLTVVLDTNLTPELIEEGFVRELVSKIQTMRKEAGFEVQDRIEVFEDGNEKIASLMKKFEESLQKEVLALSITVGALDGYTKEWTVNGEKVSLGVKKVEEG